MKFPGARGTFEEKIRPPQKFLPRIAELFYILGFGRPDPEGREIAEYWFFGPFWPKVALDTERNPGAGPETENETQFRGANVISRC